MGLPLYGLVMTMNETAQPRGATEISILTTLTGEKKNDADISHIEISDDAQ